jgi:hypothetical protein
VFHGKAILRHDRGHLSGRLTNRRTLAARGLPAVLGDCRRSLLACNFSRFGMAPTMVFSLRIFSAGTHPGLLLIVLGSEREHRFVQVEIHSLF